ncbi:MAG: FAD-dependent oxidoreductase [Chloroflexota bacterium]|nr:FAD-dependent oxidoreductase [Chloroflexota bacterium]
MAALRGHDVTLYDKDAKLGGQLRIAAVPSGKDKLNYILEYYTSQLPKAGVKMEMGREVEEGLVKQVKPDVAIIATGAEALIPDIPGADGQSVLNFWDVLSGKAKVPGEKVVVAGGGTVGCELSLHLAEQGKKVTIVEMLEEVGIDEEPITRFDLLSERLPKAGVEFLTQRTIIDITDKGVTVLDPFGRKSRVGADSVVIALGTRSVETLEDRIRDVVPEVYVIGDSKQPRKIIDATYEGAAVARLI